MSGAYSTIKQGNVK